MAAQFRGLLRLDLSAIDLHKGVMGLGAILVFTAGGSIIALIGVWAGSAHVLISVGLTFAVVLLATLAAGLRQTLVLRGMLLSVWAVLAISLAGDPEDAFRLAVAFAGGGLIAAGIIWLRTRALPEPTLEAAALEAAHSLEEVVRSPLGWFALLRAGAAGIALWLGTVLFPDHTI